MAICFACLAPHPPIILPSVGSEKDREKVKETIKAMGDLGDGLKSKSPDAIIISSPHPDWGFNVPLYFLAQGFKGEVKTYLTGLEPPSFYFDAGKKAYQGVEQKKHYAIVGSGDLSHCLKEDGPYGFNPQGPEFDEKLIKYLKEKDIKNILKLNNAFPEAQECGLRSFSFVLGILEASKAEWRADILSYQGPFGVGYLVANLKLS